jgi:hypothetical protein
LSGNATFAVGLSLVLIGITYGIQPFASAGMSLFAASFVGLLLIPLDFSYWSFGLLAPLNGIGSGMFAAPNRSAIMSSAPGPIAEAPRQGCGPPSRTPACSISIGVFFSLLTASLHSTLPKTLAAGLRAQGIAAPVAQHIASLPPVATVFAALLGYDPMPTLARGQT